MHDIRVWRPESACYLNFGIRKCMLFGFGGERCCGGLGVLGLGVSTTPIEFSVEGDVGQGEN